MTLSRYIVGSVSAVFICRVINTIGNSNSNSISIAFNLYLKTVNRLKYGWTGPQIPRHIKQIPRNIKQEKSEIDKY